MHLLKVFLKFPYRWLAEERLASASYANHKSSSNMIMTRYLFG